MQSMEEKSHTPIVWCVSLRETLSSLGSRQYVYQMYLNMLVTCEAYKAYSGFVDLALFRTPLRISIKCFDSVMYVAFDYVLSVSNLASVLGCRRRKQNRKKLVEFQTKFALCTLREICERRRPSQFVRRIRRNVDLLKFFRPLSSCQPTNPVCRSCQFRVNSVIQVTFEHHKFV